MGTPQGGPDPWNIRHRLDRAMRMLDSSPEDVRTIVWERLRLAPSDRLPGLERFEAPADIIVDAVRVAIAKGRGGIASRVREACGILLQQQASARDFEDLYALGELIYLAARVDADAAIEPLTDLITHHFSHKVLPQGETVRFRSVRALVGLLVRFPKRANTRQESALTSALFGSAAAEVVLMALIGLFHQDRAALLAQLRANNIAVDEARVDIQLRISGFLQ